MSRQRAVPGGWAVILVAVSACSFHAAEVTGDGNPGDVTVGFTSGSSLADETSGTLHLAVELSRPSDTPVTVQFAVTGGNAMPNQDYTAADGTLTFAPGETSKTIDDIAILPDNVEEDDETIEVMLGGVTGASLGVKTHTVTISKNVLPRVSLDVATSNAMENAAATFTVSLTAASPTQVDVPYTITGTATAADFGLATTGTITFPAGSATPQTLPLAVVDDLLDEDDETVQITLGQPPNAIIGTVGQQVHTIVDNDDLPVVSFTTAAQSMTEGNTGATTAITANISLTPVSGRDVTVTLTPTGTATLATDYDFAATTVTIPAGMTTATATVTVNGDVTDEPNETVVLTMTLPATPHATLGANTVHTVTINDDDLVCYGTGTASVCLDTAPTTAVTLPTSINTTNGAQCLAAQPSGWTAGGQPAACFVVGSTITGTTTTVVTGNRPLVLVAASTINISGVIDAASHVAGGTGPGSPSGSCKQFVAAPQNSGQGGGGGAGGSFMTQAGDGGDGDNGNNTRGVAASKDAASPTLLRAGCNGQAGGGGNANLVGRGGGAVYLVSGTSITISGTINVSGSGGLAGVAHAGGAGAGSGGMIMLYSAAITTTSAKLVANGGGGASGGGGNSANTKPGNDPSTTTPLTAALGGVGGPAEVAGGAGFAGVMQATDGLQGGSNNGGGGGGGAGGYVSSNLALTGATVSAGTVDAP